MPKELEVQNDTVRGTSEVISPHPSFYRKENGGTEGDVGSLHTELVTTLQTAQ